MRGRASKNDRRAVSFALLESTEQVIAVRRDACEAANSAISYLSMLGISR